ncbi:regulatory protein RecX, partial [bacterium]|nr:regulatory protein RecX [bacterium]
MTKTLKSKDSLAKARAYALRLLSYRARSRKELLGRLNEKGFSEADTAQTLLSLEKAGLVNDPLLAQDLLRYASERKHLGTRGIYVFLIKRGIEKPLINEVLETHTNESEEQAARIFAEKKLNTLRTHPPHI